MKCKKIGVGVAALVGGGLLCAGVVGRSGWLRHGGVVQPNSAMSARPLGDVLALQRSARENLAARARAGVPSGAPTEPTPESNAAFQKAKELIEGASETHEWGESQRAQFRQLLPSLHGDQKGEALRELAVAINERKFTITVRGFPF
jgi:hypothetical protein